ncbi:FAD-linked oxidase [Mycobacterium saskatchewanense]|uniref:FAD-dependent oxidoreductase n=1 Tax=Mycobacterium saskatchewanense TaxID=220927 RepID=UPI00138CFBB8|nr:FAD-dependent oxidoreductase [Mycobacterium saskatchewanense]BBX66539.1 FAD-linked oxidase [Mycobacterium saskatchewanense]
MSWFATGHGAGEPVLGDDVLLDTSALTDVTVDPTRRLAYVGAGAMWPAVQKAAAPHGILGLSGTSPTVGVAGYIFGGGVGWFVRKHGLAAATLRSVDYVDAEGRIRRAAPDASDPIDREALWAFRGGAPVGIATAVEIDLVPVTDLWTGYLLWRADDLPAVIAAWANATARVSASVTSALSVLKLPPEGPFPDELLGTPVVHLSYASPDGGAVLDGMRDPVTSAAQPVVDTTGPGDVASCPRSISTRPRLPARASEYGWATTRQTPSPRRSTLPAGRRGGLNMIELRHTDCGPTDVDGALTSVPAPFLLHAVGAAADGDTRDLVDESLRAVGVASRAANTSRTAPSFRDGQLDAGESMSTSDFNRLRAVKIALDPRRVFRFHRGLER